MNQFVDSLVNPRNEYTIYVFNDGSTGNGGLGDRLGGMITAMAFSLRTNRTMLILGDTSFNTAFRPYHPSLINNNNNNNNNNDEHNKKYNWKNWNWANLDKHYVKNMTYYQKCVNPKWGTTHCALDNNVPTKIVKYRGNRAYLCRWAQNPKVKDIINLKKSLGITDDTDLFEVAGCMLRLAMWPTEKLWNTLDNMVKPSMDKFNTVKTSLQVGFHFRCGDTSFTNNGKGIRNPQCYHDKNITWKGTKFADDITMDSPLDLALCGEKILNKYSDSNNKKQTIAYLASDNSDSSDQIKENIVWPSTLEPGKACHIDINSVTSNGVDCTLDTTAQWLLLSLSDYLIMQSMIHTTVSAPFEDVTHYASKDMYQSAPISAFSRYAMIYGLGQDMIRYGIGCTSVNKTILSRQTQGNWICDPRTLY